MLSGADYFHLLLSLRGALAAETVISHHANKTEVLRRTRSISRASVLMMLMFLIKIFGS